MVKSRSLWSGGYHADFTTILCFVCRATNYWLCANSIDELPHVFFEEHNKSKRAKGYYYFFRGRTDGRTDQDLLLCLCIMYA